MSTDPRARRTTARRLLVHALSAGALVGPLAGGLARPALAQATAVTSPEKFFGHLIGDDYRLPNYDQLTAYWQQLDRESDRMKLVDIGKTAEGRRSCMAIVTSPENHRNLERYKEIATRLAQAEGLTEAQAHALAAEGKAVVWIDGGLHANEVLGAQQLIETVYQLVQRNDAETLRILDDVIILVVHANPDGHGAGLRLVHARARPDASARPTACRGSTRSTSGTTTTATSTCRRSRRRENMNRRAVPRVVPADRVQPPPDRARRHGAVRAAVPRPVQLHLRPADRRPASTSSARRCTTASSPRASRA